MRLNFFRLMSVALLFSVMGCGGDYDDAVKTNTRFVNAMETYLSDIDKADSADAVVKAMDAYTGEIEKIVPEMKAIAAKHPEWKDLGKIPDELKPLQEKAQAMAARIPASFLKTTQYMMDEKVQKAQQRLGAAMAKMQ